jgi:hypothetical protein
MKAMFVMVVATVVGYFIGSIISAVRDMQPKKED